MQHQQKLFKGLLQDVAKSQYPDNTYYDAQNMSLVSETGLSTGVLRNIKGNTLDFTIPDTSNVVQLTLVSGTIPGTTSASLTINSVTLVINFGSTEESTYKLISDAINSYAPWQALNIKAAYSSTQVIIYGGYVNNVLAQSTITASGLVQVFNFSTILSGLTNLKILSWCTIRDDIFVLTTDSTSSTPSGTSGQVWKVTYTKTNPPVYTISLIYNQVLNFSQFYPIANPGAIIGNYEINGIQKIYFTDNFNPPRVINTADPNSMAIPVSGLEWTPDTFTSRPILQSILQGGQVLTGIYSVSYKLSNTAGSNTEFSPESSPVCILKESEDVTFMQYMAQDSGVQTSKSITWKIPQIDTQYDRIQVVVLYRQNKDDLPSITVIEDAPVNGRTSINVTYSGTENISTLTLDEFNTKALVLSTVKTIASKYNYLFPGNVSYNNFDVNFDTRAYRWVGTYHASYNPNVTQVQDTSGNLIQVTKATGTYPDEWGVPEQFDAINPNQAPTNLGPVPPYVFQSDGTTIGGEGPNISYEFTTDADNISSRSGNNKISIDTHGTQAGPAYFNLSPDSDTRDLKWTNAQYPSINSYGDYHSPYSSGSIKQYTRDETYRFGIVFYSKKGQSSFVKWIADIRIPHVYMPDPNSVTGARKLTYPYFGSSSTGSSYMIPMGVKFTINNLSTISSQISGFSIVRVKREEQDKSVVSQGVLYPAFVKYKSGSPDSTYTLPADNYWVTGSSSTNNADEYYISADYASFNSPEFLFKNSLDFRTGDYIDIVCLAKQSTAEIPRSENPTGTQLTYKVINKYNEVNTNSIPRSINSGSTYVINKALLVDNALSSYDTDYNTTLLGPTVFKNRSGTISTPIEDGYGSRTVLLYGGFSEFSSFNQSIAMADGVSSANHYISSLPTLGAGVSWNNSGASNVPSVYVANYRRSNSMLTSQYGGQSFNDRSLNEYISTGHYQSLQGTNSGYVFGGDSYICMFDNTKIFPGTIYAGAIVNPNVYDGLYKGNIVPLESTLNINLRIGVNDGTLAVGTSIPNGKGVLNKEFLIGTIQQSLIDIYEVFSLADYVQAEDSPQLYFPKPDPYIPSNTFDTRIHSSQRKTAGELLDSWTIFKESDKIDADSTQGPINNLIMHKDTMFSFQDRGISWINILERSMIQDSTGASLLLGTGGNLARLDYISRFIGSKHQRGFTQSNDAIFFFDLSTKSIYKLDGTQPKNLSLIKGMSTYLYNNVDDGLLDNPLLHTGLTCSYNFSSNEAMFSFRDIIQGTNTEFTLVYNDFIDAYSSFYQICPQVYINDLTNIWTPNEDNNMWRMFSGPFNSFFSLAGLPTHPSTVTLLLAPEPTVRKLFDDAQWNTYVTDVNGLELPQETFNKVRYYTDEMDTGLRTFPIDTYRIGKKVETLWNNSGLRDRMIYNTNGSPSVVPGALPSTLTTDVPFSQRIRGPYTFCYLEYLPTANNSLVLNSYLIDYKKSPR